MRLHPTRIFETTAMRLALCAVLLAALPFQATAAPPDNNVQWNGVSHVAWQDRRPLCPIGGETFQVRFQTYKGDLTGARVQVNDGTVTWVNASVVGSRDAYDIWAAQVPATLATTLSYWIELTDGTDVDYLSVSGLSDGPPTDGGFVLNFVTLTHAPYGATLVSGGGCVFKVWAPNATTASVAGQFNGWNPSAHLMTKIGSDFIRHVPGVNNFHMYKYVFNGGTWKPDARNRALEPSQNDNSYVINPFLYPWQVNDFQTPPQEQMVIYQLHVGTFAGGNDPIPGAPHPARYADVAARVSHLADLGVNAVMLNPIQEFPGAESAGYNPQNHFAVESTYGSPEALRNLVDALHQAGIAVLVDIVWNHFDGFNNYMWFYDGTQIYFDSPAVGTPWGDQADFDNPNVRDYFVHSALHWLEEYRIDGFRADGTDFMNMGAHAASGWLLMQQLNDTMDRRWVNKVAIAEQLPDDPWVTRPTSMGGAGFDAQYHDAFSDRLREELLDAAFGDPEMWKIRDIVNGGGAWLEGRWRLNYLELHDEAWPTSGGQRLVRTIDTTAPHDDQWAKGRTKLGQGVTLFAPGIPAFLMGTEWLESIDFGTNAASKIDWSKKTTYAGIYEYYKKAIDLRKNNAALRADAGHAVHHLNEGGNVIGWLRFDGAGNDFVVIANFSNTSYTGYRIGVPQAGDWNEALNSQDPLHMGSGPTNPGTITAQATPWDGYANSVVLNVPAMAFIVLKKGAGTVGVPGPASPGARVTLAPVRPTPAHGPAGVHFALPAPASVRLTVHDTQGRLVATLAEGRFPAGAHAARWDSRDAGGGLAPAGVYHLRLEAGGDVVTRAFPLLR